MTKEGWLQLESAENLEAERLGVEEFKFGSNAEMLKAIQALQHQLTD